MEQSHGDAYEKGQEVLSGWNLELFGVFIDLPYVTSVDNHEKILQIKLFPRKSVDRSQNRKPVSDFEAPRTTYQAVFHFREPQKHGAIVTD